MECRVTIFEVHSDEVTDLKNILRALEKASHGQAFFYYFVEDKDVFGRFVVFEGWDSVGSMHEFDSLLPNRVLRNAMKDCGIQPVQQFQMVTVVQEPFLFGRRFGSC